MAALAASVSFAAIASPAFAQCVQGPPSIFTCSGTTDVSQIIVVDDATVTSTPDFEVDTSNNGNGFALGVAGAGRISFTGMPTLTGGGVRFNTNGASGSSVGELVISSSGRIVANGDNGLWLDNLGGGDTSALWAGAITNSGGNGVLARNFAGSGELFLLVGRVSGRDDGIRALHAGSGIATITATGAVIGDTGGGIQILAEGTSGGVDLTTADVTGAGHGIIVNNDGVGIAKVDATGTVTGLSLDGIRVNGDASTTGIDIRAAQVNGGRGGIAAGNSGTGNTTIVATGLVAGATFEGILAFHEADASDISISAVDVIGDSGIRAFNDGIGSTTIVATGDAVGFGLDGINAYNGATATDLLIEAHNAEGNRSGIMVQNQGTGTTTIRASGTVTGISDYGIDAGTGPSSSGLTVEAATVSGGTGIDARNLGSGSTHVSASGTVTGTAANGAGISAMGFANSSDMRVTAIDVSGGARGVEVVNFGTSTLIATTGLVTGGETGIFASQGGSSTDLLIRAAEVQGGVDGISIEHDGAGTTTLIADTVTGQTGTGVQVDASADTLGVDLLLGDVTGGTDGVRVANNGTGITKVEATGVVTALDTVGIRITNGATATGVDLRAAQVNSNSFGILIFNSGLGNTDVVTTGLVAAASSSGIAVVNENMANDLSVSATDIVARLGIITENQGVGATSIAASGNVVGFASDGMRISNGATATDIRIDAANVEGQVGGIVVLNEGTGLTAVRASGTVNGITGRGIDIATGSAAQDLSVDVVDVTGISGIRIDNEGLGTTRVTATGTVTGTSGDGINVFAFTQTDGVEIDVADVSGGTTGVAVTNYGTGSASITASGTVSALAADGFGIVVETGTGSTDIRIAVADVLGNAGGIYTENIGSGETAIASTGTVTGGFTFGIFARNDAGATDLTIAANTVVGADNGIVTEHAGTGVTRIVAASATGNDGAGVFVQAEGTAGAVDLALGDATGTTYGVLAYNYGTGNTTVETTGAVTGAADAGIAIENGGNATGIELRAAQVSGENYGIQVENLGAGNTSVVAAGPVTASAGMGMFVFNNATAANIRVEAAGVQGAETGMLVVNQGTGTTSISAGGLVTGTNVAGIDARAGVTAQSLTVEAVDVTGASGIAVQNFGQGSAGISATGTVTALDAAGTGIAVVGGTGSTDLSLASARVVGGAFGIDTDNDGSGDTLILANGLVTASEVGIRARNGAGAEGLGIRTVEVQSAGSGIVAENLGTGRTIVRADGAVTAQSEAGIGVSTGAASDNVIVIASAVSGGAAGIWVENSGIGTTSITASGPVSGGDFGITGRNGIGATGLTITAVDAQGGSNAVTAENLGAGETRVITTGNVVGQGQ